MLLNPKTNQPIEFPVFDRLMNSDELLQYLHGSTDMPHMSEFLQGQPPGKVLYSIARAISFGCNRKRILEVMTWNLNKLHSFKANSSIAISALHGVHYFSFLSELMDCKWIVGERFPIAAVAPTRFSSFIILYDAIVFPSFTNFMPKEPWTEAPYISGEVKDYQAPAASVIMHECMHPMFNHFAGLNKLSRRKSRNIDNIAQDLFINSTGEEAYENALPWFGVFPGKYFKTGWEPPKSQFASPIEEALTEKFHEQWEEFLRGLKPRLSSKEYAVLIDDFLDQFEQENPDSGSEEGEGSASEDGSEDGGGSEDGSEDGGGSGGGKSGKGGKPEKGGRGSEDEDAEDGDGSEDGDGDDEEEGDGSGPGDVGEGETLAQRVLRNAGFGPDVMDEVYNVDTGEFEELSPEEADAFHEWCRENFRNTMNTAAQEALNRGGKGWGMGTYLLNQVLEVLNPSVDWTAELQAWKTDCVQFDWRSSVSRGSRRIPRAEGRVKDYRPRMVVYVDSSGSVSDEEYAIFMSEIIELCEGFEIEMYDFTGEVHEDTKRTTEDFRDISLINREHCGGTDYHACAKHFEMISSENKYGGYMIFTDGEYGSLPDNMAPANRLWVTTRNYDQMRAKISRDDYLIDLEPVLRKLIKKS